MTESNSKSLDLRYHEFDTTMVGGFVSDAKFLVIFFQGILHFQSSLSRVVQLELIKISYSSCG